MYIHRREIDYFVQIYIIHIILTKYGLLEYFESYIRFNILPSKNIWKHLVKYHIHENEPSSWLNRVSAPEFDRFRQLYTDYSPHFLWIESKESCHLLAKCRSCLQMIAGMAETAFSHACCQFCNIDLHTNAIDHYIQSQVWYLIVSIPDLCTLTCFAHILMQRESVYGTIYCN